MKTLAISIFLITAMGALPLSAREVDCEEVSALVTRELKIGKFKHLKTRDLRSKVIDVVSRYVESDPECVCEIVKAAIRTSRANPPLVAAIVEAAYVKTPGQLSLISQCAIAVAPDAARAVRELVAKLDPNGVASQTGDELGSSDWNPLDFPGDMDSPVRGPDINPGPVGGDSPPVVGGPPSPPVVTDPNP